MNSPVLIGQTDFKRNCISHISSPNILIFGNHLHPSHTEALMSTEDVRASPAIGYVLNRWTDYQEWLINPIKISQYQPKMRIHPPNYHLFQMTPSILKEATKPFRELFVITVMAITVPSMNSPVLMGQTDLNRNRMSSFQQVTIEPVTFNLHKDINYRSKGLFQKKQIPSYGNFLNEDHKQLRQFTSLPKIEYRHE
jgi:hypothetical protein